MLLHLDIINKFSVDDYYQYYYDLHRLRMYYRHIYMRVTQRTQKGRSSSRDEFLKDAVTADGTGVAWIA